MIWHHPLPHRSFHAFRRSRLLLCTASCTRALSSSAIEPKPELASPPPPVHAAHTFQSLSQHPSLWIRSTPRSSSSQPSSRKLKHSAHLDEHQQLVFHTSPSVGVAASASVSFTFRIRHVSPAYVHQASLVFEEQANKLNLYLHSVVPLPTKIKRWTLLRSPHVDKQSKEQLELRTHKRLITVRARGVQDEAQIEKLQARLTGMIQNRVTMRVDIPAHTPIHTLTFRPTMFEEDVTAQQTVSEFGDELEYEGLDGSVQSEDSLYDEDDVEQDLWHEEDQVELSQRTQSLAKMKPKHLPSVANSFCTPHRHVCQITLKSLEIKPLTSPSFALRATAGPMLPAMFLVFINQRLMICLTIPIPK